MKKIIFFLCLIACATPQFVQAQYQLSQFKCPECGRPMPMQAYGDHLKSYHPKSEKNDNKPQGALSSPQAAGQMGYEFGQQISQWYKNEKAKKAAAAVQAQQLADMIAENIRLQKEREEQWRYNHWGSPTPALSQAKKIQTSVKNTPPPSNNILEGDIESIKTQGEDMFKDINTDPNYDTKVVDLRDYKKAIYVVSFLPKAPTATEADLLLDEALNIANGENTNLIVPAEEGLPQINQAGLIAFQQANIDYKKNHDLRLKKTESIYDLQKHQTETGKVYEIIKTDYEKAVLDKINESELNEKHKAMSEVFKKLKEYDRLAELEKKELELRIKDENTSKEICKSVIKNTVLNSTPIIADELRLSDDALKELQKNVIDSRNDLEKSKAILAKDLEDIKIPVPKTFEKYQEGVVLGMFTNEVEVQKLKNCGSPFLGQSYIEMNRAAEKAKKEGKKNILNGAVVASFGTPDQSGLKWLKEIPRVLADHLSEGLRSLTTPQGKKAIEMLSGKEFDRLIAHSNGASIAEALINHEPPIIKVKELNIMGGDRSLFNGNNLQKLINGGRVQRIVVWVNLNDIVPWLSSPDQIFLLNEKGKDYAEHVAKMITGDLMGGDSRVEYKYMWDSHHDDPLSNHYINSYYDNVANKVGTLNWKPCK